MKIRIRWARVAGYVVVTALSIAALAVLFYGYSL